MPISESEHVGGGLFSKAQACAYRGVCFFFISIVLVKKNLFIINHSCYTGTITFSLISSAQQKNAFIFLEN